MLSLGSLTMTGGEKSRCMYEVATGHSHDQELNEITSDEAGI